MVNAITDVYLDITTACTATLGAQLCHRAVGHPEGTDERVPAPAARLPPKRKVVDADQEIHLLNQT
jgi:hypothetical protein